MDSNVYIRLYSANAKDTTIIPQAHGFKPLISRLNSHNPKFKNPVLKRVRQNINKGISPAANKPPRALSGFRIPHKSIEKQSLYAEATGFGGSGSSSSGSTKDDSNPFNTKSSN